MASATSSVRLAVGLGAGEGAAALPLLVPFVSDFGAATLGQPDGLPRAFHPVSSDELALLGGKGAGLVQMCRMGLPVPAGFVLTTQLWQQLQDPALPESESVRVRFERLWAQLWPQVSAALTQLGDQLGGLRLGDPHRPLLLAVRSGAVASMPGMLDSVLNLGLNDASVAGLASRLGPVGTDRLPDRRGALDCYRRFLQQYSTVVLGLRGPSGRSSDPLEVVLSEHKQRRGIWTDEELTEQDLETLCQLYQAELSRRFEVAIPTEPQVQLREAVWAVLHSWENQRAQEYRRIHGISDSLGTAVTVQAMVLGNLQGRSSQLAGTGGAALGPLTSATGVAFTRDPSTGAPTLYGEYLPAAQGDEVVSGSHTPHPLSELATQLPDVYRQLQQVAQVLEQQLRDMQDIEFTVENGRLWLLQTRTAKRSGRAMLRSACDLAREGVISVEEALRRLEPRRLIELIRPQVDRHAALTSGQVLLGRGLAASPGAAVGKLVFSSAEASALRRRGEASVLARIETASEDIVGIKMAAGVLTARGGMTSHAAVVARGIGRCAVVGMSGLQIDYARGELRTREAVVNKHELLTLDGTTGEVWVGTVPLRAAHVGGDPDFAQLRQWTRARSTLQVESEADDLAAMQLAADLGIEAIGLLRSEPLLFQRPDGLQLMLRHLEPSVSALPCSASLTEVLAAEYTRMLSVFVAGTVTLRMFDVRFLRAGLAVYSTETPWVVQLQQALAKPQCERELWLAQLQAVVTALRQQPQGLQKPRLKLLLPGVAGAPTVDDLHWLREQLAGAPALQALPVGAQLSHPRAASWLNELAPLLDFVGLASSELTAAALGLSSAGDLTDAAFGQRAQAADHPLRTLDATTVQPLLKALVTQLRAASPSLPVGLLDTGEHGYDERSLAFAQQLGLAFVTSAVLRVPMTQLLLVRLTLPPPSE